MKGARFWAVLMAALLTFTTLTNDYMVASAEESQAETEETASVSASEDDAEEAEDDDYELSDPEEVTEEESEEVSEDENFEDTDEEEALTDEELIEEEEELTEEEAVTEEAEEETEEEEEESPAIDFGSFSVSGMKVTVYAPEGAFPEGTTVEVNPVSSSAEKQIEESIGEELDDDQEVVDVKAVDFTFRDADGQEIEPDKDIDVHFYDMDLDGEEFAVFHIDDAMNATEVTDASVSSDSMSMSVGEFTTYAAVGLDGHGGEPQEPQLPSTDGRIHFVYKRVINNNGDPCGYDQVKYTVKIFDYDGKTDITNKYTVTNLNDFVSTGSSYDTSQFASRISVSGGKLNYLGCYFLYDGKLTGPQAKAYKFENFKKTATGQYSFDSYIGYLSDYRDGKDYDGSNYMAYNPYGTLVVTYQREAPASSYKVVKMGEGTKAGRYDVPLDETTYSDGVKAGDVISESTISSYATEVDGYEYVSSNPASGSVTVAENGSTVITLYYKKLTSYTVKYLEQGTNKELKDDLVVSGKVGASTGDVNAAEITGYSLAKNCSKTQSIRSLNADSTKNVITFFYTADASNYKIVKMGEGNTAGVYDVTLGTQDVSGVKYGDTITEAKIDEYATNITGYVYDHRSPEGTVTVGVKGTTVITLYYKKALTSYTVKYLEQGTENHELKDALVVSGKAGASTGDVEAAEITGYSLAENCSKTQSIESLNADSTKNVITFFYTADASNYTIVKMGEGNTAGVYDVKLDTKVVSGVKYGDTIAKATIDAYATEITGYEYNHRSPDGTVTVGEEGETVITLYYKKALTSYTVYYKDNAGNEMDDLKPKTVDGVQVGTTKTETAPVVTGYTVDAASKDVTLDAVSTKNEITFIYTPNKYHYTVHYEVQNADDDNYTEITAEKVYEEADFGSEVTTVIKEDLGTDLECTETEAAKIKIGTDETVNVHTYRYTRKSIDYTINYYTETLEAGDKTVGDRNYVLADFTKASDRAGKTITADTEKKYENHERTTVVADMSMELKSSAANVINVYYDLKAYKLTVDPNGGTYNGTTGNTEYADQKVGSTQPIADPVRTGYKFTGWTITPATSGSALAADGTFTMGTADTTLTAQWEQYTYSIEVYYQTVAGFMGSTGADAYEKTVIASDLTTADGSVDVALSKSQVDGYAPAAPGYTYNEGASTASITLVEDEEKTLNVIKLYYDLDVYTVDMDWNAGSVSGLTDITADYNSEDYENEHVIYDSTAHTVKYCALSSDFVLPVLKSMQAEFLGWKQTESFTGIFTEADKSVTIDTAALKDFSYKAKWSKSAKTNLYVLYPENSKPTETTGTKRSYSSGNYTSSLGTAVIDAFVTGNYDSYAEGNDENRKHISDFSFKTGTIDSRSRIETRDGVDTLVIDWQGFENTTALNDIDWYVIKNESGSWHVDGAFKAGWTRTPFAYYSVVGAPVTLSFEKQLIKQNTVLSEAPVPTFTVPEGYYFAGWSVSYDGTAYSDVMDTYEEAVGDSVMPDSPIYFVAHFARKSTLTLTANSLEHEYTGDVQTVTGEDGHEFTSSVDGLRFEGVQVVNKADNTAASATDVTEFTTAIIIESGYKVYSGTKEVTDRYTIEVVDGTFKITPAALTVETPDDTKVYDGEPLKAEGTITGFVNGETAAFTTTGEQTEVGTSTNTYEIAWDDAASTAKESNYTVEEKLGTLEVTEYDGEILVTITGGTYVYDGTAKNASVDVTIAPEASAEEEIAAMSLGDAAVSFPKGYTVETAESTAAITHAGTINPDEKKDFTLKIVNAQNKDVTDKLNITYDSTNSAVTITPAPLTVTTKSASKRYDGEWLHAGGSVSGLIGDETLTFKTTGKQKSVGSSKNTYTITWDGTAQEADYEITENLGTLTVNEASAPGGDEPTPEEPGGLIPTPTTTTTDAAANGVLGARRGIEADGASVLGARRVPEEAAVLGARRDGATSDASNMALYLMLMGIAAGVGGAYTVGRRKKHEK